MLPMRKLNSLVTAADVAVFLMAANSAPKRITGGGVVKVSPEMAAEVEEVSSGGVIGRSRLGLEGVDEYKYRLASCRSRKPGLETITEEPIRLR